MTMIFSDKSRENHARRVAERRGFRLEKSRRRDPRAIGYGKYQLIDAATNTVASMGGWLTLMEVENQLEILSAVQDPSTVRMIQAVVALAKVIGPLEGLDPVTVATLGGPVTVAAKLLGGGIADELAAAVEEILAAEQLLAAPDVGKLDRQFYELRASFEAYQLQRGRLPRPLMQVPFGITRPLR